MHFIDYLNFTTNKRISNPNTLLFEEKLERI